jgi:hypothetical protein
VATVRVPITVWAFHEAPERFQHLSQHGGDEDWLAFVPQEYEHDWIRWLEEPHFAPCSVSRHEGVSWGGVRGYVVIGAHA